MKRDAIRRARNQTSSVRNSLGGGRTRPVRTDLRHRRLFFEALEIRQLLSVGLIDVVPSEYNQHDPPQLLNDGSGTGRFGISGDGRYVAFLTNGRLVTPDTNGDYEATNGDDVFVRDTQNATLARASTNVDGDDSGDTPSGGQAISADGRYVVFHSAATNLVSGDTNGQGDVFLRDLDTETTTRVSTDTYGNQVAGISEWPTISPDGSYAAFESTAPDLVYDDTNNRMDVFAKSLVSGLTTRVSTDSNNGELERHSCDAAISDNGRYIAFASVPTDGDDDRIDGAHYDIYVKDRQTWTLTRVTEGNGDSGSPVISPDGRYVAFQSAASDLVSGDTNGVVDVFVWDRDAQSPKIKFVSTTSTGEQGEYRPDPEGPNLGASSSPAMSSDGRYIAFASYATNFDSTDGNNRYIDGDLHGADIFVKDMLTDSIVRVNKAGNGDETYGNKDSLNPAISADGRYIAFQADSANLIRPYDPNDPNDPPWTQDEWRFHIYRVMNPLLFIGTSGNDTFDFSTTTIEGTDYHQVSVTLAGQSAQTWTYAVADDPLTVTFTGSGGNDTITITGTTAEDKADFERTSVTFSGNRTPNTNDYAYYVSASGIQNIKVIGGGGAGQDMAHMYDSSGDDKFWTNEALALLTDGTIDTDDGTLNTQNNYSYYNEVSAFPTVYAYRSAGGYDKAYFRHNAADEHNVTFNARSYQGYVASAGMSGNGFWTLASDFNEYYGYGIEDYEDEAYFRTTGGGDTITFNPSGTDSSIAELDGTVPGTPGKHVYLYAEGFKTTTVFRDVDDISYSNIATLYGTSGNDTLAGTPTDSTFTLSTGPSIRLTRWSGAVQRGIDQIYVYGEGGNDTATLTGASSGTNTLWGKLADAVLSDGTVDTATGDLTTANSYYFRLSGFDATADHVNVTGPSTATNDKHIIGTLDYTLALTGTWIDI